MSIQWSTEQRRATATAVLNALISNTSITTTTATAEEHATEAALIANKMLNALDGTVAETNQAEVVQAVAPTVIRSNVE